MLSGRPALPGEALGTEGHADVVCCGREDSERICEVCSADLTCGRIVSSELKAAELEGKLLARIRQFDFGAKDVDVMVVTWPVDFLPS